MKANRHTGGALPSASEAGGAPAAVAKSYKNNIARQSVFITHYSFLIILLYHKKIIKDNA
jgi:hypothetical protein